MTCIVSALVAIVLLLGTPGLGRETVAAAEVKAVTSTLVEIKIPRTGDGDGPPPTLPLNSIFQVIVTYRE